MNAHAQYASKFDILKDPDGTWSVYDLTTRRPAEMGGRQLTGLRLEDADELLLMLSRKPVNARPQIMRG